MRVCVDAGHGMSNRTRGRYDPGVVAAGVAEADVALAWALTLKHFLTQAGHEVEMTRRSSEDVAPLVVRQAFASDFECDYLVSLHCNAPPHRWQWPVVSGVETFEPVREVPGSLGMLAGRIHQSAVAAMGLRDRGLKRHEGRLAILSGPVPGVLVELGFLTHPTDRRRLLERERRIAFADRVVRALDQL